VSGTLALSLHLLFFGDVGRLASAAPASLAETAAPVASTPAVAPKPKPQRPSREPAPEASSERVAVAEASASSVESRATADTFWRSVVSTSAAQPVVFVFRTPPQGTPEPMPGAAAVVARAASRRDPSTVAASPPVVDAPAPGGSPPPLLAAGDQPPPVYKTQLPASVTLHYDVRRGFLHGDGEIRWQARGDAYRLVLEARVAGLTLLMQTSEGGIDASGIAPVRFVDKRARRASQEANFRRELGKVTFSGTGDEWPLLDGSQDRLSWMIQLAGIAAAQPQLLVEGGRITMAVFGARGDAAIWSLRYAGHEEVATPGARVRAIKLVREPSSARDSGAEVWLDPGRSYLPVRATLLDSAGSPDYDLLLERAEAAR
jgi:hypothetical protein